MKPRIYLAGAIRDDHPEDISWREHVIEMVQYRAIWLNPLASKTFDPETKNWTMSGIQPKASVIVPHDFWMVEHSDVIVFNLTSMQEGYPSIGSLVEFGHATGLHPRPLIYTVLDTSNFDSQVQKVFGKLHPFLEINSAVVFDSVDKLIDFLVRHLPALSGDNPHFNAKTTYVDWEEYDRG